MTIMSGKLPRSFVETFPLNEDMQQTHTTRNLIYFTFLNITYQIYGIIGEDHSHKIRPETLLKKITESKLLLSYPEHE